MIRTFFIPVMAIAGILLAVWTVVQGSRPPAAQPPVIEPPTAPFGAFVAGSGLVEASSDNIAIGAPVGAIVTGVLVKVGDDVAAQDPLFELDSRDLNALRAVRAASLATTLGQLARLKSGTRPELLPAAEAGVQEAKAQLQDQVNQLTMLERLSDARATSAEELSRRRFAVDIARARLQGAEADLNLLKAGGWGMDVAVAESQVNEARAQVDAVVTELDRRVVRAPVAGRVLQVNIRPGEFAQAGALARPLVLMGTVIPLHVRVDIDEHESWRVLAGAPARAFVRGNKDISTPLSFVRFEPYIVPKRSLTGESNERVDTRVLQVLYSFDGEQLPVFVGQQMDVYIEAAPIDRQADRPTGRSDPARAKETDP